MLDRNFTAVDHIYAVGRTDSIVLPRRGYLAAVTAELDLTNGSPDYADRDKHVQVWVTTGFSLWNGAVFGKFEIHVPLGFNHGGVLLPEPIPDMADSNPCVLMISDNAPPLRIHTVTCGMKL